MIISLGHVIFTTTFGCMGDLIHLDGVKTGEYSLVWGRGRAQMPPLWLQRPQVFWWRAPSETLISWLGLIEWACHFCEPLQGDEEARAVLPSPLLWEATPTPLHVTVSSLPMGWGHTMRRFAPWWPVGKASCIFFILHSQALPTVCLAFPGHIREQVAMPQQGGVGFWPGCYWRVWTFHIDEQSSFHSYGSFLKLEYSLNQNDGIIHNNDKSSFNFEVKFYQFSTAHTWFFPLLVAQEK